MELSKEMDEFVSELTDEFARELAYQDATREKIRVPNAIATKKVTEMTQREKDKLKVLEETYKKKKEAANKKIEAMNVARKKLNKEKKKRKEEKMCELWSWVETQAKQGKDVVIPEGIIRKYFGESEKKFDELVVKNDEKNSVQESSEKDASNIDESFPGETFKESISNENNKLENNETEIIPEKEVSNSNSNSADNSTTAADLDDTPYELDPDQIELYMQQIVEETIRAKKVMGDPQSPLSTDNDMGEEK